MKKLTLLAAALCFAGTVLAAPITGSDALSDPKKILFDLR